MKKYYEGLYGGTASIYEKKTPWIVLGEVYKAELIIRDTLGRLVKRKKYKTFRAAKAAMARYFEFYREA